MYARGLSWSQHLTASLSRQSGSGCSASSSLLCRRPVATDTPAKNPRNLRKRKTARGPDHPSRVLLLVMALSLMITENTRERRSLVLAPQNQERRDLMRKSASPG